MPKLGIAYAGVLLYIPAIIGAVLVNTLPSSNRVGLLFSYWVSSELFSLASEYLANEATYPVMAIVPFVNGLTWVSQTTAGHTKRITVNAIVLIGYAIGNAASPFMWKKHYQPRCVPSPS